MFHWTAGATVKPTFQLGGIGTDNGAARPRSWGSLPVTRAADRSAQLLAAYAAAKANQRDWNRVWSAGVKYYASSKKELRCEGVPNRLCLVALTEDEVPASISANHRAFARAHGLGLCLASHPYEDGDAKQWAKILVLAGVQQSQSGCQAALWIDSDVIFTNLQPGSFHELLDAMNATGKMVAFARSPTKDPQVECAVPRPDLDARTWSGNAYQQDSANNGVFVLLFSPWSAAWLAQIFQTRGKGGIYDNGATDYWLAHNPEKWRAVWLNPSWFNTHITYWHPMSLMMHASGHRAAHISANETFAGYVSNQGAANRSKHGMLDWFLRSCVPPPLGQGAWSPGCAVPLCERFSQFGCFCRARLF